MLWYKRSLIKWILIILFLLSLLLIKPGTGAISDNEGLEIGKLISISQENMFILEASDGSWNWIETSKDERGNLKVALIGSLKPPKPVIITEDKIKSLPAEDRNRIDFINGGVSVFVLSIIATGYKILSKRIDGKTDSDKCNYVHSVISKNDDLDRESRDLLLKTLTSQGEVLARIDERLKTIESIKLRERREDV